MLGRARGLGDGNKRQADRSAGSKETKANSAMDAADAKHGGGGGTGGTGDKVAELVKDVDPSVMSERGKSRGGTRGSKPTHQTTAGGSPMGPGVMSATTS